MIHLHTYDMSDLAQSSLKKLLTSNLARYTDIKVPEVKLRYHKNGKPSIKDLNFSISHSKNILVQAFTKNGNRKYFAVAKRCFHSDEYQHLQSLDKSAAISCFYHLWTVKEAVCKAKGGRLWYYLADNYLENSCSGKKKNMVKSIKGLNILQFNKVKNFSLTIASEFRPVKVNFVHE